MEDTIVRGIAAQLHDAWRAGRRLADGSYQPRWKDGGTLDIANTDFADLPTHWQAENLAAARSAWAAVTSHSTREDAADHVHRDWLARNADWAPAEQAVDYAELTEDEKDKDRAVVDVAAAAAGVSLR